MIDQGSTQPTSSATLLRADERLKLLLPGVYRDRTDQVKPVSMGSAPLAFDLEGNVAWDRMWGSFCDLAMAGGPPHKGKLLEPGTPESIREESARYTEVCAEIARGIGLAASLRVSPHSLPGWLRVPCGSVTAAEWLFRAITMENVSVRLEGSSVLLPAGPAFRLEKEIKNVITVVAKTVHYWSGHLTRVQQLKIADLLYDLSLEMPLFQPAWELDGSAVEARQRIESTLASITGLKVTSHGYAHWIGLECASVPSAVNTMRRLVASNVLSRREETAIFLPLNPSLDPTGIRLATTVAALLEREA